MESTTDWIWAVDMLGSKIFTFGPKSGPAAQAGAPSTSAPAKTATVKSVRRASWREVITTPPPGRAGRRSLPPVASKRAGARSTNGPRRVSLRSDPERVRAVRRAAVDGDDAVPGADQVEDALHVGAEVEARDGHAGDADPVRQVADGEAGVVHHLASGVAGQAVADPVEAVGTRELEDGGQVGDDLAELRVALLDEEDVAVPVVHDGLADGVAAEDAGRAEGAGDARHDLEARVDLHEREVLPDAVVPALHGVPDRGQRDHDRVGRVDARPDLGDDGLAVAGAVARRADVIRRPVGEDEVHRAPGRRDHAGAGADRGDRDARRARVGRCRAEAVRIDGGVRPGVRKRYLNPLRPCGG